MSECPHIIFAETIYSYQPLFHTTGSVWTYLDVHVHFIDTNLDKWRVTNLFWVSFSQLAYHGNAKSSFGQNVFKDALNSVSCFTGTLRDFPNPNCNKSSLLIAVLFPNFILQTETEKEEFCML